MYVYFVKTLSDPAMVKIGKSDRVKDRVQALQTSCPHKLELLGAVQFETSSESLREEELAHKALAAHRLQGEWFELVPEIEEYFVSLERRAAEQAAKREAEKEAAKVEAEKRRRQRRLPVAAQIEEELKAGILMKMPTAAEKYRIDLKRLRGYVWQENKTGKNELPIGCFKMDVVYDDWRLQRLAQ